MEQPRTDTELVNLTNSRLDWAVWLKYEAAMTRNTRKAESLRACAAEICDLRLQLNSTGCLEYDDLEKIVRGLCQAAENALTVPHLQIELRRKVWEELSESVRRAKHHLQGSGRTPRAGQRETTMRKVTLVDILLLKDAISEIQSLHVKYHEERNANVFGPTSDRLPMYALHASQAWSKVAPVLDIILHSMWEDQFHGASCISSACERVWTLVVDIATKDVRLHSFAGAIKDLGLYADLYTSTEPV